MSIWDDPDLKISNDFYTFETVGDTASGVVQAIRVHRWPDNSVSPEILLTTDDGEEKTLTAGQIKLKTLLSEQRPEVGDHITVKLTDIEKRSGGKTLKHFSLDIKRGSGGAGTAATAMAPSGPAVDQAAVAAALAALSPEQRQAMGLPAA